MTITNLSGIWTYLSHDRNRTLLGTLTVFHVGAHVSLQGMITQQRPDRGPAIRAAPYFLEPSIENIEPPVIWNGDGRFDGDLLSVDWRSQFHSGRSELRLTGERELRGKWLVGDESDDEVYVRMFDFAGLQESMERYVAEPHHVIFNRMDKLKDQILQFVSAYPYDNNVFVMMRYRSATQFRQIEETVATSLGEIGLVAHFAKDKTYSDDLWENLCVYMLGCKYGLAVFEEIDEREFNPNVSLELGFMYAAGKRCLVLKDKRMARLPTDICGRVYKDFDTYSIGPTIRERIQSWGRDLGLGGHHDEGELGAAYR